jgi:hypothetical protein
MERGIKLKSYIITGGRSFSHLENLGGCGDRPVSKFNSPKEVDLSNSFPLDGEDRSQWPWREREIYD